MGEPLVIASHLPGEGHFRSERFEVAPVPCADGFDYWRGLADHWSSDRTLINVEHDMEAGDEHVHALVDCPRPLCSWAYRCNWISTGLKGGVIAAGNGARIADHRHPPEAYYLQGGEEWAKWSAIGLVKITPEARVGPLRREPWQRLELAVHDAVKRPWCMHWDPPLNHWHW